MFLNRYLCVENPVCYEEGYRVEVLVILPKLERLDQDVYEDEERQEAEEVHLYFYTMLSYRSGSCNEKSCQRLTIC